MSHSRRRAVETIGRRGFLKTGVAAAIGTAAIGSGASVAGESSVNPGPILTRPFGKTGRALPILGSGGAALPMEWCNPLSTEDRNRLVRQVSEG